MRDRRPEDCGAPFQIICLASGSRGNCHLVCGGGARVLVDAGISARRVESLLRERGFAVGDLDGVIVTHEHQDHTAGLRVLTSRHGLKLYATELTRNALGDGMPDGDQWVGIRSGVPFRINGLEIEPFPVPHDAYDPVGLVIQCGEARLGIATDLGYATALVRERLRGCHALLLEANYDEVLLREDTRRPWAVKQRIAARHGHLSNRMAADLAAEVAWEGLRWICLGHLSEDCNDPEKAVTCVRASLQDRGYGAIEVEAAGVNGHHRVWTV